MTVATMPLTELTTATIKLLCREIGIVNTIRFINQFTAGYGNYTEEREQLIGHMTVDEIVADIKRQRRSSKLRTRSISRKMSRPASEH
jgi:transposase-like protein